MRLSDCFMELIAYTALVVRDAAQAQLPYEQVRSNIHQLISQSEAESQQGRFAPEDFNLARFAVFAWIDETILHFKSVLQEIARLGSDNCLQITLSRKKIT